MSHKKAIRRRQQEGIPRMTGYKMTPERTEAALMCALTAQRTDNPLLADSAKKMIEDFGVLWVQSLAEEVISLRQQLGS